MVSELPGRNAIEPVWPRKYCRPKAEPSLLGRRQHGASQRTDAAKHFGGGGRDSTVTRACQATGETLLAPLRNRRSRETVEPVTTGKQWTGRGVRLGL